jgi:hypothetical protein
MQHFFVTNLDIWGVYERGKHVFLSFAAFSSIIGDFGGVGGEVAGRFTEVECMKLGANCLSIVGNTYMYIVHINC